MTEPNRFTEFLQAATAGLKKDRELQLDVQAELRSHLEERQQAALTTGLAPEAAEAEAIRAMGTPAELAADLQRSNRQRMRLRAWLRLAAQWLLAPVAILVAVLTTDWGSFKLVRALKTAGGEIPVPALTRRHLTSDQRLVLQGDTTKSTRLAQQKAIWEKWPTNKVYLHNYVTHLLVGYSELGQTPAEQYATLAAEIEKLRPLDPDNARFDFILAGRLLDQAVEIKSRQVKGPDGKSKSEDDITIKDRAQLNEAMTLFKAGLAKPEWRRYTREMTLEQLAIVGEPTSLLKQIAQIGLLAGMLLPDLSLLRDLERTTLFYGELLASEGRRSEADFFLNAHRQFVPQILNDAYTLIDVLVVGAVADLAASRVPAIYEKLGDAAAAERARLETAPLAAPVKQWKEKRRAADKTPARLAGEETLRRHAGILTAMLLPALDEYPTAQQLAPARELEYVAAEGILLTNCSLVLCLLMAGTGLTVLWFRWVGRGDGGGMLLVPEIGEVLRLLALGVVLPLVGYYLVTRWLPWGGRELSLRYGGPALLAQFFTLMAVIIGLTGRLVGRIVRRRCSELLLPVPPSPHRGWRIVDVSLLVLIALPGLLPAAWLLNLARSEAAALVFWVFAGLVFLTLLVWCVHLTKRGAKFGRACAAYYGTLARTMIPVLALALILVNVCSRPYLRWAERRCLLTDTLMSVDPNGGFTRLETRVTQRLKAEIQKAAEKIAE